MTQPPPPHTLPALSLGPQLTKTEIPLAHQTCGSSLHDGLLQSFSLSREWPQCPPRDLPLPCPDKVLFLSLRPPPSSPTDARALVKVGCDMLGQESSVGSRDRQAVCVTSPVEGSRFLPVPSPPPAQSTESLPSPQAPHPGLGIDPQQIASAFVCRPLQATTSVSSQWASLCTGVSMYGRLYVAKHM